MFMACHYTSNTFTLEITIDLHLSLQTITDRIDLDLKSSSINNSYPNLSSLFFPQNGQVNLFSFVISIEVVYRL
jgi:hypothetical protein